MNPSSLNFFFNQTLGGVVSVMFKIVYTWLCFCCLKIVSVSRVDQQLEIMLRNVTCTNPSWPTQQQSAADHPRVRWTILTTWTCYESGQINDSYYQKQTFSLKYLKSNISAVTLDKTMQACWNHDYYSIVEMMTLSFILWWQLHPEDSVQEMMLQHCARSEVGEEQCSGPGHERKLFLSQHILTLITWPQTLESGASVT